MKYLLMMLIVVGLAISDVLTGFIKAHAAGDYCSKVMRRGGLNKLGELIVMATAVGLEIGMTRLGAYYDAEMLADIAGNVTAISVFAYITVMELISVFENFAAMNPDAPWAKRLAKRLRNTPKEDDENA